MCVYVCVYRNETINKKSAYEREHLSTPKCMSVRVCLLGIAGTEYKCHAMQQREEEGGKRESARKTRDTVREKQTLPKKKENIHGCHLEAGALAVGATEGAAE